MRKWWIMSGLVVLVFAVLGRNPFAPRLDVQDVLAPGYSNFETGTRRLSNGTYQVATLTGMPNVTAGMVRWWFADFMQTTEHYTWWHPKDHVWMDWENKRSGEIIGASHLVHEYIGGDLHKMRIQFVDPTEFFGYDPNDDETFVICARTGLLDKPLNVVKMCHVVRNTEWGAEMRSRFWLGHVAVREGNETRVSLIGLIGNTALARLLLVDQQSAQDVMTHAIEEMEYLSDLLPRLYAQNVGEGDKR